MLPRQFQLWVEIYHTTEIYDFVFVSFNGSYLYMAINIIL